MTKLNPNAMRVWGLILTLGFSALAESIKGQGTIVYVTPQPAPYYSAFYPGTLDFTLDIDRDGTTDFILRSNDPGWSINNTVLIPQGGNSIVSMGSYLANMNNGDEIGSSLDPVYQWSQGKPPLSLVALLLDPQPVEEGNFAYQESGYIGFDVVKNGMNYYGWISVSSPGQGGLPGDAAIYGELVNWAYQTSPNTPILVGQVPEPSTVALIVVGAGVAVASVRHRNRPRSLKAHPKPLDGSNPTRSTPEEFNRSKVEHGDLYRILGQYAHDRLPTVRSSRCWVMPGCCGRRFNGTA